jgi:hypothetical protein
MVACRCPLLATCHLYSPSASIASAMEVSGEGAAFHVPVSSAGVGGGASADSVAGGGVVAAAVGVAVAGVVVAGVDDAGAAEAAVACATAGPVAVGGALRIPWLW